MHSGAAPSASVSTCGLEEVPPRLQCWTALPPHSATCGSPALHETPSHRHIRRRPPRSLAPTQNGCALRAHFVQTDSDLAVGCLAERSRILAFHTHGVPALLRETGVINHPYRIRLQFLNHPPSQSLPHRLPFPRALPHELLHRLLVAIWQPFGHRLNRLPLAIQQQTTHVD